MTAALLLITFFTEYSLAPIEKGRDVDLAPLVRPAYTTTSTLLIGDTKRADGGKEFKRSLEDFSGLFGISKPRFCIGDDANPAQVMKELRALAAISNKNSRVIIDIVCHGRRNKDNSVSLVLNGGKLDGPDSDPNFLPLSKILYAFSKIPSTHKWLIIDACFAGNAQQALSFDPVDPRQRNSVNHDKYDTWRNKKGGTIWLGSYKDAETSYVRDQRTRLHQAIISAASNQSYLETLSDFESRVREKMPAFVRGRDKNSLHSQMYLGPSRTFSDMVALGGAPDEKGYDLTELKALQRSALTYLMDPAKRLTNKARISWTLQDAYWRLLLANGGERGYLDTTHVEVALRSLNLDLESDPEAFYTSKLLLAHADVLDTRIGRQQRLRKVEKSLSAECLTDPKHAGTPAKLLLASVSPKLWVSYMNLLSDVVSRIEIDERGDLIPYKTRISRAIGILDQAISYTKTDNTTGASLLANKARTLTTTRSCTIDDLDLATSCIKQAQRVYTKNAFPSVWNALESDLKRLWVLRSPDDVVNNEDPNPIDPVQEVNSITEVRRRDKIVRLLMIADRYQEDTTLTDKLRVLGIRSALDEVNKLVSRDEFPYQWAQSRISTAIFYQTFFPETKAYREIIDRAYKDAFEVYTKEEFPVGSALLEVNYAFDQWSHSVPSLAAWATMIDRLSIEIQRVARDIEPFSNAKLSEIRALYLFNRANVIANSVASSSALTEAQRTELSSDLKTVTSSLREVQEVITESRYPLMHAQIMYNIGNSYSIWGDIDPSKTRLAVDPLSSAIRILIGRKGKEVNQMRAVRGEVLVRQLRVTGAELSTAIGDLEAATVAFYDSSSPSPIYAALKLMLITAHQREGSKPAGTLNRNEVVNLLSILRATKHPAMEKYILLGEELLR
jgi:hypothetical protein